MKVSKEFLKFCVIGVMNTGIHLVCLFILTEYFHIYYVLSSVLAFLIALVNSFIFNSIWTFESQIKEKLATRFMKFFAVSVFAGAMNILALYMMTEFLGIWYILSQILATVVSKLINFTGYKFWTFRRNV